MLSIALRSSWAQLRRLAVVLFAAWVLLGQSAMAQTTGTLAGTVLDQDGLEIPGADVTISSPQMIGGSQSKKSDAQGRFRFAELLPGLYDLRATAEGFSATTMTGITVLINNTATVQVTLQAGNEAEIVVEAKEDLINTESTTVGQVLTKEFLQRIPSGRSYQEAVQLTAGVTGGANPNMAGAASNENTFMLDGATVTDPVTGTFGNNFNYDAIQQIEVLLGGYDAEYGISLGGIVNIVTESGTNNLQFETSAFYQQGDWRPREDARFTADGFQLGPTGFDSTLQTLQISAKVSGPLVQDKAWFIFSYQHDRSLIALTGIPQRRDYDGHYMLGKLTIQPSSSHRISLLFQADPTTIDNLIQSDIFQKAEAQARQAQSGFVAQLRWQWFINQDMNLDTRVNVQKISIEAYGVPCTHNRDADVNQCEPGEEEGTIDFETPGRTGINGAFNSVNFGQYVFDDRFRFTASSKYTLLGVQDKLGGQHEIKIGVETNQYLNNYIFGYGGNTLYIDLNRNGFDPETFTNYYWLETTGPILQRNTGSTWSAFIQDAYKPVSNFTLRFGVRLDNTVLRNDVGEAVISGTMVAPRIFASWDPWGNQLTKIAGGYGRFNEQGRQSLADFTSVGSLGSKLFLGEFFDDGSGQGFLNSTKLMYDSNPRLNTNTQADGLLLPYVDEFNFTIQRQIVTDVALGATLQTRFTRNLYAADELNLIYDEDGSAIIGSRRSDPLNQYLRLRTPRQAERNYYRVDAELTKRNSRRWFGQITYSYTYIDGTTNQSLGGSFRVDPQTVYNYGRLITASEHAVRGFASWQIPNDPWTTTIGASITYDSGTPLERFYWGDAFGGGYSIRIRNRGYYYHFNDVWEFGLRITQAIDVRKGRFLIDLTAENVFNNRAPSNLSSSFYSQNRLFATSRQTPLRLTLGLRYQY
ncbi:MAG: TonB-dependent receptor [Alphaproteobacteria bacterium]|nr:TonB-dependent receptor [Alphaproteobacteria bacterium]